MANATAMVEVMHEDNVLLVMKGQISCLMLTIPVYIYLFALAWSNFDLYAMEC